METDDSSEAGCEAFEMSSIDIEDTNQDQASDAPQDPIGQGDGNNGRQHEDQQLGWLEWMVSLCTISRCRRRAPSQETTVHLPDHYTEHPCDYWTDKRKYLALCILCLIALIVMGGLSPVYNPSDVESSPSTGITYSVSKSRLLLLV